MDWLFAMLFPVLAVINIRSAIYHSVWSEEAEENDWLPEFKAWGSTSIAVICLLMFSVLLVNRAVKTVKASIPTPAACATRK